MQWTKNKNATYSFSVQGHPVGELRLQPNSNSCLVVGRMQGHEIHIRRVGFWKSRVEITDAFGSLLLEMQPQKWHADSFAVRVKGQLFTCRLRQSPLAEYVLLQEDAEVLAYQLVQEGRQTAVRIRRSPNRLDESLLELHLLLWYLFLPLSQEDGGEQPLQWLDLAS